MSGKRMKSLRLIWLEAFVLAVDGESFTKAGAELGINQGTASKYVTYLEDWLGLPLTDPGTTVLTSAGERFIPVARQVIAALTGARALERHMAETALSVPISAREIKI
jgi:DNA-binding transcriptional LysR family regulator